MNSVWRWNSRLTARGEERLQEDSAVGRQNARGDVHLMIEPRVGEDFEAGTNRAALRVVAAVHEPRNARLNHGPGAHAARLDGNVERGAGKAVIAQYAGRFAQHDHLGVGRRVAVANGAIARARDDFAFVGHDGSDWHFACRGSRACFLDGLAHEFEIGVHAPENSTRRRKESDANAAGKAQTALRKTRPSATLLDNSQGANHTTAHDLQLGNRIAQRFSKGFCFIARAEPGEVRLPARRLLKNPAWKFDEIPSHKAGLFWGSGNRCATPRFRAPLTPELSRSSRPSLPGRRRDPGRYAS